MKNYKIPSGATFGLKRYQAFSLIELLVVLTISGILVGIGIPGFQNFIKNGRLTAQINETIGLLNFSRSEAIKNQNFTITLCASPNYYEASPSCAGNEWHKGWILFSNSTVDTTIDGNDRLIKVGAKLSGNNTLITSGFANAGVVQFDNNGWPSQSGTFTLCDDRGASFARAAIISVAGQTRQGQDQDNNNIVNNHEGDDVTCP